MLQACTCLSAAPMAPKAKDIREMGFVEARNPGHRAAMFSGAKKQNGPTRATKSMAEADLARIRGASSRENVSSIVAELCVGMLRSSVRLGGCRRRRRACTSWAVS